MIGRRARPGIRLDLSQHVQPIDLRHVEVEQHQAWVAGRALRIHAPTKHEVERRFAVLHPYDLLRDAADLERADREFRVCRIVVGEQDVTGSDHAFPWKMNPGVGLGLQGASHAHFFCPAPRARRPKPVLSQRDHEAILSRDFADALEPTRLAAVSRLEVHVQQHRDGRSVFSVRSFATHFAGS